MDLEARDRADAADPEIAVLITDIVGSTEVSRRQGDRAYYQLVMRHHALVRSCLARSSGHEFSDSGDGLLAWFPSRPAALAAALEIQRQVSQVREPAGLRVRVSLACGRTLVRDGRPYGLLVSLAVRLLERAEPGQVVVDARFAAALPPGLSVRIQEVDLKGFGPTVMGILQGP